MKTTKPFIALLLCTFLMTGCTSTIYGNPDETDITLTNKTEVTENIQTDDTVPYDQTVKSEEAEVKTALFGEFGTICETKEGLYFLKLDADNYDIGGLFGNVGIISEVPSAICLLDNDGNENIILEDKISTGFVVTDHYIYYNDAESIIYAADRSGENKTAIGPGKITGVTENGGYIVYTNNDNIYTLSTADNKTSVEIAKSSTFIDIHNDVIYYTPYDNSDEACLGKIALCCSAPDGKDNRVICVTAPDVYDDIYNHIVNIVRINYDDEYIYFSYGATAGSAVVYQSGNISRVKYDGSGYEVLEREVGADFYPENGKVVLVQDMYEISFSPLSRFLETDSDISEFTRPSGKLVPVIYKQDYLPQTEYECNSFCRICSSDNYISFVVHSGAYNPEKNIGWRDYYDRDESTFFIIHRETGNTVYSLTF